MELLKDITRELASNMGGARCKIYVALHHDIEDFPTKRADDENASLTQLAELDGNFVFKPGKKFFTINAIEDTVFITSTDQGEISGMSQLNTIQFAIAGNDAEVLGFQQRTNNRKLVIVAEDKEGLKRVIGSEFCGAFKVAQNSTTGENAAARKHGMFSFGYNDHGPAPIYKGTLDLESGSGS